MKQTPPKELIFGGFKSCCLGPSSSHRGRQVQAPTATDVHPSALLFFFSSLFWSVFFSCVITVVRYLVQKVNRQTELPLGHLCLGPAPRSASGLRLTRPASTTNFPDSEEEERGALPPTAPPTPQPPGCVPPTVSGWVSDPESLEREVQTLSTGDQKAPQQMSQR